MKRAFNALAAGFMLVAAPAQAQTPAATPSSVSGAARHVVIMDGASGAVLYCDDCQTPIPPASMSKLMTVLVVEEAIRAGRINLDTRFPVSENAWRHGAMSDGSHMFLELGSTVSVRDLLQGVIVVSANDACIVLAEGLAGSEEAFVVQMNQRAQALGLRSAHFRNATGLPDPEHVISTADLARITRHLITSSPELYRIYSQPSFTYNNHTQENRNPLLGAFQGADGVKTGHTEDSGYGLVGSAVLSGQRRIIVFNGTSSMAERRSEAQRLMRAAFHDFSITQLASAGQVMGQAAVDLGSRPTVQLAAQHNIVVGGARAEQVGLRAHIVYQGPLRAPIQQGAVVAYLVVDGDGAPARRFPLVAASKVGGANWFAQAWRGLMVTIGAH
jgi:D-alanyl-D-alanine carboxypeptidase (penicillin-binding protein 5/6)